MRAIFVCVEVREADSRGQREAEPIVGEKDRLINKFTLKKIQVYDTMKNITKTRGSR